MAPEPGPWLSITQGPSGAGAKIKKGVWGASHPGTSGARSQGFLKEFGKRVTQVNSSRVASNLWMVLFCCPWVGVGFFGAFFVCFGLGSGVRGCPPAGFFSLGFFFVVCLCLLFVCCFCLVRCFLVGRGPRHGPRHAKKKSTLARANKPEARTCHGSPSRLSPPAGAQLMLPAFREKLLRTPLLHCRGSRSFCLALLGLLVCWPAVPLTRRT